MKIKKSSLWYKILAFCMILCFAFISTGCIGLSGDEGGEDFDDDDFNSSVAVEMYGAKVLYRPDDYDYNVGSGGTSEVENDYYGQYAYQIMNELFGIYGLTDIRGNRPEYITSVNADMYNYLYDSIRYQLDTIGTVTNAVVVGSDGSETEAELTGPFYIVGADPSVAWNWTMEANTSRDDLRAYAYADAEQAGIMSIIQDNKVYININSTTEPSSDISTYYNAEREDDSTVFSSSSYRDIYLTDSTSGSPQTDYEHFSDYVKTLEYAIYCYAIDDEPDEVTIDTLEDGSYSVQIGDYASVDDALADAKESFRILGAYVGLVDRQIEKIQNWILENIIGEVALNADDTFTIYNDVTVYMDESSNILRYDFSGSGSSRFTLGRDYETAVENIMAGVCEYVPIGSEGVTIDQRFLASEIMEYAGNMFMIADDSNFPAEGTATGLTQLQPLEYQSVVLMLSEEIYLDGLTIALKYDADLDGTEEDVYDTSKYLDIIVDINYYNSQTKERQVLDSKQVRVYDGPYDEEYWGEGGDDHVGDGTIAPIDHTSALMFDDLGQVHVGKFNVDVGDGILKTDVGSVGNYTTFPWVSQNPLVLVGTTDVRRYYEVVEYGTNPEYDTDELESGKTYISGRFNPEMFGGDDGCDYIEITYKVIKNVLDKETNYKFYTGIAFVDYNDTRYEY